MKTNTPDEGDENKPVVKVSWDDVKEIIKKLNEKEGMKYRLPTEAEWESAARAGTTTRYFFGDNESDLFNYAVCNKASIQDVGMKQPNQWGLFDMYGNAYEWVQDNYHENYGGAPTNGSAWEDNRTTLRVIRGGKAYDNPKNCRAAYRKDISQTIPSSEIGFRLARNS